MPEQNRSERRDTVCAEPGTLTINAQVTLKRLVDALAVGPANELMKALEHRQRGEFLFAHAAGNGPSEAKLNFASGVPPTDRRTIWNGEARQLPGELVPAGFSATYTSVLDDYRTRAYTSGNFRQIGVLGLEAPVTITAVVYPKWSRIVLGFIKAPNPALARVTGEFTLPAGQYLIGEIGSWGTQRTHVVRQVDRVPAEDEIASIPGVRADRIIAVCDRCRARWVADHPSMEFQPTGDTRARSWDYGKATGHADNRVNCPAPRCNGRVAFSN